ncbi:xanthine dehydrogenase family protein subunit M [Desulfallas sp. Bu1-1]|uniref:FAD binding domain-containing protein n=1 Tax=Desulfallas sp. Bu1-1 TaxID=2787620 RepID=UPI00189F755A|nr:xanthine dehydrogenase family protein subunit M [Desulfallas sp. Bu1-1]MBF7084449.1 xanthine dehydrogenase family protein subunit M [Desulfallas sp. Bu1-1]
MKTLTAFEYIKPALIDEALYYLNKYGDSASILAGGTDLLVRMKHRQINPAYLIDIKGLAELSTISYNPENGLVIGALAKIHELEINQDVQAKYGALAMAAEQFATAQVRNMATIVGNICRSSPAADMAPPLLALDAKLEVFGLGYKKLLPLKDFFTGPGTNQLKNNEILTRVMVPPPGPCSASAFIKLGRTAEDLAKVSVAVYIEMDSSLIKEIRIALGAVAPTPIRAYDAEAALKGRTPSETLIKDASHMAAEATSPVDDLRSTAAYRREVGRVLVERMINKAIAEVSKNGRQKA